MADGDREHLPELIVPQQRLGRHVNHDPRSRAYRAPVDTLAPRTKVWRRHPPPFDQGQLGSCTANAVLGCAGSVPTWERGRPYSQRVAVRMYRRATALDPFDGAWPPYDTGSDGLSACKAAVEAGYATRYLWGFGVMDLCLIVSNIGPCAVGAAWYEGMDEPDPSSGLVRARGRVRGGHEWQVIGYHADESLGAPRADVFEAQNSWGKRWGVRGTGGLGGRFFITAVEMAALLHDGGDCVTLATNALR